MSNAQDSHKLMDMFLKKDSAIKKLRTVLEEILMIYPNVWSAMQAITWIKPLEPALSMWKGAKSTLVDLIVNNVQFKLIFCSISDAMQLTMNALITMQIIYVEDVLKG